MAKQIITLYHAAQKPITKDQHALATLILISLFGLTACNQANVTDDRDNDGIANIIDAFPDDANESEDTDQDGIGNNADPDDDNDGVPDDEDAFPTKRSEWLDTDSDGVGNNADLDDDNDGYEDTVDAFPVDVTEWADFDLDGIGNNADSDDDNDGVTDQNDQFPLNAQEYSDFDDDGFGDNMDNDDDNDGQQDNVDLIDLFGNTASYQQSQFVSFRVRGYSAEKQALLSDNGWNLQYTVYNAQTNQPITSLSSNGYFNGQWDSQQQSWRVYFPAPDYQIEYQTKVTIYCSLRSYDCDGTENNAYQIEEDFNFTVYCETENSCQETHQPHKATQLTNSPEIHDLPIIQINPQGELLVAYRDFANLSVTPIVTSVDNGENWQTSPDLPESHYKTFTVFSDGTMAALQYCNVSICLYQKHPDGEQRTVSLQNLIADADIDLSLLTDSEGNHYPFSHFTLYQTSDAGYIIGFTVTRSLPLCQDSCRLSFSYC